MSNNRLVVQFPHPGGEHDARDREFMDWNLGGHARKFMTSPGRWVDGSGNSTNGDLQFWGEWEAPSYMIEELPGGGGMPRFLHKPIWTQPPDHPNAQNTDPYVFGDRFHYSNCKQNTRSGPRRTQRLDRGSMILFGSYRRGDFVVDTVFVVGDSQPTDLSALAAQDPAFRAVTGDRIAKWLVGGSRFRLFEGATFEDQVDGMFSFVPALPDDTTRAGFIRPTIRLDGVINQRLKQGLKFTTVGSGEAMRELWERVVDQVLAQGLVLGVQFSTPEFLASEVGASGRGRGC